MDHDPYALAEQLRDLAEIGFINARKDAAILLSAARVLEEQTERCAIMSESKFAPDANFDGTVWHYLPDMPHEMEAVLISYRDKHGHSISLGWRLGSQWHKLLRACAPDEDVYAWAHLPMPAPEVLDNCPI